MSGMNLKDFFFDKAKPFCDFVPSQIAMQYSNKNTITNFFRERMCMYYRMLR